MSALNEIENFKIIQLGIKELNRNKEDVDSFINRLNTAFKSSDLKLVGRSNEIEICLNRINVSEFDKFIEDMRKSENEIYATLAGDISDKIKGIKNYGLSGNFRQYVGYNKERKVKNRDEKIMTRGKHYYANNNDFLSENNDFPESTRNKIICADSELFLKNLPENCVDAIFTSPPYNFGLDYEEGDDSVDWESYFAKLFKILTECVRVLKYGGRLIVNVQPLFSDYIPSHHLISNHLINQNMIWKGEILWEKNNYNCKYTAWGSWKNPSSPYLKYTWEFLEIFCKGALKKDGDKSCVDINAEDFKKWVVAKWSIAPERNMKKYDHPAMFPEELVERALKLFTFKGDVILDPFAGVGTTCAVAKKTHRDFVGIDISQAYCDTAEDRIKNVSVQYEFGQ